MTTGTTETRLPEGYVYACDVAQVPVRGKRRVWLNDDRAVLIIACNSDHYAVEDKCPQTGGSLAHGKVLDGVLTTPTTGARYELASGKYLGGGQFPLQTYWLKTFSILVRGGKVYLRPR